MSSKYSFLTTNYSSGVSVINILNVTDTEYAAGIFLLLGNFGAESTEIVQISSVNSTTGDITLTSSTKFAHAESSKISILPYNQIRFYWTATTTFSVGTATSLSGLIELQPSDWFTAYNDETHSTGYGWYLFYNSNSAIYSQESNYIPYAGFEDNTVEDILADFFSMLSNKDLRLITREDALSFASEAYGRVRNKLNLTNIEFTASAVSTLTIVPGTVEYDLPSDFDHLIAFVSGVDSTNPGQGGNFARRDIEFISLKEAYSYTGIGPRYYIRGSKIGILPTPEVATTYQYIYNKKASRLSLETDKVDLPNGGEYLIKSFMLYRAYAKFQNMQMAKAFLDDFTLGLNDCIIASVKRDANLDKWGIMKSANV